MPDARAGRCWYCGEETLKVDDPPEHIIPAALGGTLTTDRVCAECNRRAGQEIDWPLQNDWLVASTKQLHDVVSSRTEKPGRAARWDARRTDEPETVVDVDRKLRPMVRSRIERNDGGDARIVASSDAEAARLRDRLVRQLAAEGLQIGSEAVTRDEFNEVSVDVTLDGIAWLRAGSKMALGALSRCLNDSWLDSEDARRLRRWLWESETKDDNGVVVYTVPSEPTLPENLVVVPPMHAVTMMTAPVHGQLVGIGLFGSLYVPTPIAPPSPPLYTCWLIPPGDDPHETTWWWIIHEATRREIAQANEPPKPPAS